MPTFIRTLALSLAVAFLFSGHVLADVVIPVGINAFHQGDSLNGNGSTLRVLDGSGMSQPDLADPTTWRVNNTGWAHDWQGFSTPNGTNRTWAVLDLGALPEGMGLDTMHLWNVQEQAPGGASNRGMNAFDIYFADSPTVAPPATGGVQTYDFASGGWSLLSSETLPQGTGTGGGGDAGTAFDVSGAAASQYIGFKMNSNHGGNRTGFAEVAFTTSELPTVPEPSSIAIWSLIGLALVGFRSYRQRRNK